MKNLLKNLNAVVKAENSNSEQTPVSTPKPNDNDDDATTKAAELTQTLAYKMFTYLLPWGVDTSVDTMCKTYLHLTPPNPEVTFAVTGYVFDNDKLTVRHGGKITVLVPSVAGSGSGRWQFSEFLSSLHSLSGVAFSKCLLSTPCNESRRHDMTF